MDLSVLFLNPVPLIKYGIALGFAENGCKVYILDKEDSIIGADADYQASKVGEFIDNHKIDIVFWDFGAGFYYKEIYQVCKEKGTAFYVWSIEDIPSYPDFGLSLIPYCDCIFTTCEELLPSYRSKGRSAELLLFGVSSFHTPKRKSKKKYPYDILLVSNNYSSRHKESDWFIKPLLNENIGIYGNSWWIDNSLDFNLCGHEKTYKGYLPYEELPVAYNTVPVVLGVNCNGESRTQTSMRMYEFLACTNNSLMVSFYTKAQKNIFGNRIYLPHSEDETKAAIKEILDMPVRERKKRAIDNRKWVVKNHNYKDRAKIVLKQFYS